MLALYVLIHLLPPAGVSSMILCSLFVCLFVTEETCQVCPAPASVRKHYEGAYGVNPMPVGHSEAAMTGIFTRL